MCCVACRGPGRVTGFTNAVTGSSAFSDTGTLGWNTNGSLHSFGWIDGNHSALNQSCTYSSAALNRLAAVSCGSPWGQTFSYDALGNVTKTRNGGTSYSATYNAQTNQVASAVTATYDAAGNLLSDNISSSYTYDAEGRVVKLNSTTSYVYDAEGRRVAKQSVSGSTTTLTNLYLLGLGGEQVSELGPQGNWIHSNVYAGGALLATYNSAGLHFQFADWLGSRRVQSLVPSTGTASVEEICTSLPYGDVLTCNGTDATEQHYTGKERDSESGLDMMGARYYGSSMGRFMSPDPSGLVYADPTNPQSFNLYAYAWNNPLKNIDPSGLSCQAGSVQNDDGMSTTVYSDDGDGKGCEAAGIAPDGTDESPDVVNVNADGDSAGTQGTNSTGLLASICGALPSASVGGVSGALGGIAGPTGSLELVTNYRTGQVSGFAAGGVSVGWNGGASAAAFSGQVWGLKGDNSNYSGGFTSGTLSASVPAPHIGVQATISSSSGGLTGNGVRSIIPDGQVNSATLGVSAGIVGPLIMASGSVTNYSAPKQLGKLWTMLADPIAQMMFIANQACAAAGH